MRIFLFTAMVFCGSPALADLSYTTAGAVSFPSSVVPSDSGNVNAETSFSVSAPVSKAVTAYTTVSFQRDTDGNNFASKQKLSFGLKTKRKFKNGGNVSVGARFDFDNRNLSGVMYRNFVFTADYGIWRRLEPANNGDRRTLSGWANLRYQGVPDISAKFNLTAQGRFEIARRLAAEVKGLGKPSLSSFTGVGFGADSFRLSFNNKLKFDTGIRFKWKVKKHGNLSLNIRYTVDRRPLSDVTYQGPSLGLSWYVPF